MSSAPLVFYASQSGSPTLDEGEGGGNPFASALIELLQRPSLTLAELHSDIVSLTSAKSDGFQVPESPAVSAATPWSLKPVPAQARRVALVFVYADYQPAGVNSLPGAARDLLRVASALANAGFVVDTAVDPTTTELREALESLAKQSTEAEAAVIYLTGHGLEHHGDVYLLPNDHSYHELMEHVAQLAIHVPGLVEHLHARSANLVFFGGCRTLA
ncbi:MAG: caspase family protein [Cytophagaceae bacterium]|nr:caspase family protein [Gemmatimonadaceae bacterium]